MNTEKTPMYKWKDIPWRKLERNIFKLQKRIYRASCRGDVKTVHRLQKLLIKSWSAKCLAVRKVSQDNQGKKTAGIDGVKSLSPSERLVMVKNLKLEDKTKPVRRVWIPKPGKQEKRPLGIPIMYERAKMALVKLALEPEWEARFEANSYGFRPGRSCQDSITAIHIAINKRPKYVLDADIAKCFDNIDQQVLLAKLKTYPTLKKQIRAWLKAGVVDGDQIFMTEKGTPQGGVVSPLLANIALHGLENKVMEVALNPPFSLKKEWNRRGKERKSSLTVVRYADDFVILHDSLKVILYCQKVVTDYLAEIGLELKPEKTRIAHTLNSYCGEEPGFNFLGFKIRQYQVSKYKSGKTMKGFVTHTKPTLEKIKEHYRKIAEIIDKHKGAPQKALISHLNPIIRGWANYYRTGTSSAIFSKLDYLIYKKLWQWAKRRHHNKSNSWIKNKYWHTVGANNWVFKSGNIQIVKHSDIHIQRHIKVTGQRSPFDGDLAYWSTRMGRHPQLKTEIALLMKKQKGKCKYCGLHFRDGDLFEVDHITPRVKGGSNQFNNKQLIHRHCHDSKTASDYF